MCRGAAPENKKKKNSTGNSFLDNAREFPENITSTVFKFGYLGEIPALQYCTGNFKAPIKASPEIWFQHENDVRNCQHVTILCCFELGPEPMIVL